MILELNSVGSVIDTETGITYAAYQKGGYDHDSGIHIDDCDKEWVDALSDEDVILINEHMDFKRN